ncbi:hypothetical protein JHK82_018755 [Glycine max]|uniref:Retrotransposon Copia-like N-terminal domain-containing protein n=2 Tax=Glycine subgen. Soja TaxID=1462606 RepID=K7L219_SOYBN|nr:hypothetical protein JHK87_018651 [Glycine soja]KAG5022854.1 hypothetical protein JHK85_019196 [Glycine max]KAG5037934.1 hypothetical protein JHK86_018774 [Glycine max]KAG5143060.1 hypothetical protein JHK82_018755 [Glycine max]KAH1087098.1 hypothetical protein GYH30_018572 [Glycine max]|eukprot:XP_025984896.1 uncharacterized protein LOC113002153 [Glycine max]
MDPISIKLGDDNYSIWKAEALGKIKKCNLEKFITMTNLGGKPPVFSEEYKSWEEQDQVLYWWLLDSLHPEFLIQMERCDNALELWMEIEVYFLEKEIEELGEKHKSLIEKHLKLKQRLWRLDEECLEISNENEALEEELVKEHGPESVADILSMKHGTAGSA